ncbi:hypothetical protein AVEN_127355-1 [Araneus ventricosus]|uniref:Uncharacterized protein n=1 Tax=Araneus ventricosus TaxID=182803 RepID=A0A4Y2QUH2_ARAVE|nr:hypothetical protein AVEN_127355-1 [Araneus ventricosus]
MNPCGGGDDSSTFPFLGITVVKLPQAERCHKHRSQSTRDHYSIIRVPLMDANYRWTSSLRGRNCFSLEGLSVASQLSLKVLSQNRKLSSLRRQLTTPFLLNKGLVRI